MPEFIQKSPSEKPQRRRRAEKGRGRKDTKNNRRNLSPAAYPAPDRGRIIRIIAGLLIVVLAVGFGITFNRYSQSKDRLETLKSERQAAEAQHQKDIGYYVQMRRVSGFDSFIRQYAQEFSVDRSFISAIIARESSYVATAQSSAGARGLMQIMPDTGDWAAGRLAVQPYNYDRLFEPELNIRMGAWYLNYLSSQFGGDPVMIVSAFHAGANNVKQWAMKYGADQKTITMDQIPTSDTKDYVKKVMKAYSLFYEYDIEH